MSSQSNQKTRVAIVGTGQVGATTAYRLMLSGLVEELVLIDARPTLAEGHAMDLSHAASLERPVRVRAGSYEDCAAADVVVICAGAPQVEGESRLALLERNVEVLRGILAELMRYGFDGLLLITTNPVDVLSMAAHRLSGLPATRVIGTGTVLDSARLRHLIGQQLEIDPRSVHAHILGEHGDSEIAAWSAAQVGGLPLSRLEPTGFDQAGMLEAVRRAAPEIIARKGATYYAIASSIQRIVTAILRDERAILPVSARVDGPYGLHDVYLGTPCVVGRAGIVRVLEVPLDPAEQEGLRRSAAVLRGAIERLGLDRRGKSATDEHG
jgi:L-lactate dehydrogenase